MLLGGDVPAGALNNSALASARAAAALRSSLCAVCTTAEVPGENWLDSDLTCGVIRWRVGMGEAMRKEEEPAPAPGFSVRKQTEDNLEKGRFQ